jgi:myo-inositol catabolism protein IolS
MKQVQLGRSDLFVSQLTVGCWSFGGNANDYWGAQDQGEVDDLVKVALDRGVNFFDTAFGYNEGRSEMSLGQALQGMRSQAIICNKIPIQPMARLPEYKAMVEASLKRLGTDVIDVMMIHWPVKDEPLLRANLEALHRVQQAGLIRQIGVSNFGIRTMEIAAEMGVTVIVNEFAYNLMSRAPEYEILPYVCSHQIGFAAYMPLMQGILTGKYKTIEEIPNVRRRSLHFDSCKNPEITQHCTRGAEAEVMLLLDNLGRLQAETGLQPGQVAMAWLLAKPGMSTAMAGCRNVRQLEENVAGAELVLDPDLVTYLDEISRPLKEKLGNNVDLWQSGDQSRIW